MFVLRFLYATYQLRIAVSIAPIVSVVPDVEVVQADITTIETDAIVNAANSSLMGGGGVDGAIHRVGGPTILEECQRIVERDGPLDTGEAVVTSAGSLPARYVIHTVGPIWGEQDEKSSVALLAACYKNSLDAADEKGCARVTFPNISTGVYRFPKDRAAETALTTVKHHPTDVDLITFVCFDVENMAMYRALT